MEHVNELKGAIAAAAGVPTERIEALVTEGRLTREQADEIIGGGTDANHQ